LLEDPRVDEAMDRGDALGRVELRKRLREQAEEHPQVMKFLAKNILRYHD
jgi:hypothetical protein